MSVGRLKVISQHLNRCLFEKFEQITHNSTSSSPSEKDLISDQEFLYTLNNSILTRKQRQFYEENGYLVIPSLIENYVLDKCINHFVDICNGRKSKGGMTLFKEMSLEKIGATGEHLYYKIQNIMFDEIFMEYLSHPKMLDYVQCFTGPNITGVHSMLINKPPDANTNTSRHPLHQDLYYFPFRPTNLIVGSWTAMESIHPGNGCLFVIPGSHKAGELYQHDYPETQVNVGFHGVKGFDDVSTLPLSMEKGDTVFLHPLLLHGSGINTTKGFRKAISCHYAASECYYIDVTGTVQENIANEIKSYVSKKGLELDYNTIWKLKSRAVRGNPSNLSYE
uniref:phytanoyl-CoA dioxygenase n=1 Tax=Clastoptera arizonana TaxID=38151 RepID=A0A1B6CEL6_9HEMI